MCEQWGDDAAWPAPSRWLSVAGGSTGGGCVSPGSWDQLLAKRCLDGGAAGGLGEPAFWRGLGKTVRDGPLARVR